MALKFPQIDPVLIGFGELSINLYGLAYVVGIVLGWLYLRYLNSIFKVTKTEVIDDLITYSIIGILVGGRLGYALLYQPEFYLNNPIEILKTWKGGMAFHGGAVGFLIATYILCKKHKVNFLKMIDLCVCVAPVGVFFGRLANFTNGELFGRVTDVPWAVMFPLGGFLPRHPSQLYEALGEGLFLAGIMYYLVKYTNLFKYRGMLLGVATISYAAIRFMIEFYREPDQQIGLLFNALTLGQLLSISMVIAGSVLIHLSINKRI
jgi:phosphatidylglycerol---prolipoprotein diacylglyceryl transferase